MTNDEIIQGLQFTIDMFLFDPFTGESLTEPRNDDDKITIDACREAITALRAQPCEDAVKREAVLNTLDTMDKALDEDRTVEHYKGLLAECYKALPPVIPKQKTGKWIVGKTIGDGFTCNECNTRYRMYPMIYRFCPNCGAKMEGESE